MIFLPYYKYGRNIMRCSVLISLKLPYWPAWYYHMVNLRHVRKLLQLILILMCNKTSKCKQSSSRLIASELVQFVFGNIHWESHSVHMQSQHQNCGLSFLWKINSKEVISRWSIHRLDGVWKALHVKTQMKQHRNETKPWNKLQTMKRYFRESDIKAIPGI